MTGPCSTHVNKPSPMKTPTRQMGWAGWKYFVRGNCSVAFYVNFKLLIIKIG
jgi:hypothetical protein